MGPLTIIAILGLCESSYFLAVYNGYGSKIPVPKIICKKNECVDLLKSSYAKLFGIPNFVYGLLFYAGVLLWSLNALPAWLYGFVLAASVGATVFSMYLAYVLITKLKVRCMLCYIAHFINISILLLLLN